MRRDLSLKLPTFFEALQKLGYYKTQQHREPCLEWRHKNFHIILRLQKTRVTIHLHVDIPIYGISEGFRIGKPHRARQHGEDITKEWNDILRNYKLLRGQRRPIAT